VQEDQLISAREGEEMYEVLEFVLFLTGWMKRSCSFLGPQTALAVPGQKVSCTIAAPVPVLYKGLSMSISVRS